MAFYLAKQSHKSLIMKSLSNAVILNKDAQKSEFDLSEFETSRSENFFIWDLFFKRNSLSFGGS